MRQLSIAIAVLSIVVMPQFAGAQGRGNGGAARGPKTTTHAPRATAQGPKSTTTGPKSTARGPKATAASGSKTTATARAPKTKTAETKTTGARASRTDATATSASGETTAAALPKNPRLVERLRDLLPAGTDMDMAASGFRNQGQFVAAVHVSNNLGIPFEDLKTRMVTKEMSLGQAIQDLRPAADADGEVRRATRQADDDLKTRESSSRRRRQ